MDGYAQNAEEFIPHLFLSVTIVTIKLLSNKILLNSVMTIETKYSIGDEVWLMWYNKPIQTRIIEIRTTTKEVSKFYIKTFKETIIEYIIGEGYTLMSENKLFSTKEELIKSL
jgi:hypothetical protein